jgi:hypothetical protein
MEEKTRELGQVKLVQVQPVGLRIETSSGRIYDPSRRVEVDRLYITSEGIEADTPEGERVLDIHHTAHPDTHYKPGNTISIGFTSHYAAMRNRFGEHMVDGSAGENVIIEFEQEVWPEHLGRQIVFENPASGERAIFDMNRFAAPCEPFSHFAAQSQHARLPADKLKATLQFLDNGRRGFLLGLSGGQGTVTVQPGDRVYTLEGVINRRIL